MREWNQPQEIMMIRSKRERNEEHDDRDGLTRSMHRLTFSVKDPRPKGSRGDNPLVIQWSIKNITIHWVYIETGSSADTIYEHCFFLLPDRWKENLKPTTGRLIGFTGHNLWTLGTIHLPFTLTSHEKRRKKIALIDFVVLRHPTEHNIILGRTTLLKFRAVPSIMHGIVKFSTT